MKRLSFITIPVVAALIPLAALAVAATATPSATPLPLSATAGPSSTPTPTALTRLTAAAQATRLATLKSRGDAEIQRRLTNLQAAEAKVNADTKLTSTDKTVLTGQLTTEISGLGSLKTSLDSATILATARTDVQSIFDDYRVYALMLPKAYLVATADAESTTLQKFQTYEGLLATKVSSTNTSLVDMQAQLTAASGLLNGFVAGIINLQPSDYNSDHTLLAGKRTTLVQVRTDLVAAQTDAETIRLSLK